MDPNNNQTINTNPLGQQPVTPEPVVPQPAAATPKPVEPQPTATPFTNPLATPSSAPVPPAQPTIMQSPTSTPMTTPASAPEKPKGKGGKAIMLVIILILLILGMTAYVLFTRSQIENAEKAATENKTTELSLPTATPTLAPENDLEVTNPDADLKDLEADVSGL
jgi:uncharacterized protein HemX